MKNAEIQLTNLIELTGKLVSAYVSNNPVRPVDLSDLIHNVHAGLNKLVQGTAQALPEASYEKPTILQIRKSVTPDGIVSFLDGKTYQTLKRHLRSHGFDSGSYRARFGLPADYPMVAARYAAKRSELAKAIGLGRVAEGIEDEQRQAIVASRSVSSMVSRTGQCSDSVKGSTQGVMHVRLGNGSDRLSAP